MGYSQESGYIPTEISTMMVSIMNNINIQFNLDPAYTTETFVGTNAYKYFYALVQKMQEGDVTTSEVFQKLQVYIDQINARISRPVTTQPGTIEAIELLGYQTSVKKMILADAGTRHICIDVDDGVHAEGSIEITDYANLVAGTDDDFGVGGETFTSQTGSVTEGDNTFQADTSNELTAQSLADQINAHAVTSLLVRARVIGAVVYLMAIQGGVDGNSIGLVYNDNGGGGGGTVSAATLIGGADNDDYPDVRLALCTLISQITVGGVITIGTEEETIVLTNGQAFDFSFNLPNRLYPLVRLTTVLSENNQLLVGNPDDTRALLLANINERYRLGKNFEPQRYFAISDAPWASSAVVEYSLDAGATWLDTIYDADYDELFMVDIASISLVES